NKFFGNISMLQANEREEIARLWARKLEQDQKKLPQLQRHRNLEPDSAEFICALASGIRAKSLIEIGGSSGLSTITLAVAARLTGGRLTSFEIEETRQQEARGTCKIEPVSICQFYSWRCRKFSSKPA